MNADVFYEAIIFHYLLLNLNNYIVPTHFKGLNLAVGIGLRRIK